jgi:hypothetical protein
MARLLRLEPRRSLGVVAGLLSAMLHLGLLLLIVFSGGRQDGVAEGDTPLSRLVMLDSRITDRRDGIEVAPVKPSAPEVNVGEPLDPRTIEPPSPLLADYDTQSDDADDAPPVEIVAPSDPV